MDARITRGALTVVAAALLVAGALRIGRGTATGSARTEELAPAAEVPPGEVELIYACPFVTDEPFVHEWRKEQPLASGGYLLVLKVDPELARPRQTYERVLYVGAETAERCNAPWEGGVLVVLVPAPVDAGGLVQLDLASTPIWFGEPELPERVDAARIARERTEAAALGLGDVRHGASVRLRHAAADTIRARTRHELQPYVDELIERYSVPAPR